jgi:pSer/pThr/pTyr-binding forkhead associated (FHA) protein
MRPVSLQERPAERVRESGIPEIVVDQVPVLVGRDKDCTCPINLPFVSRQHCLLFLRGDKIWVKDLESLNGTYLNEERVRLPQPVRDGDLLRLGHYLCRVRLDERITAPH